MWIEIAVVILANGDMASNAVLVNTREACLKAQAAIVKRIEDSDRPVAYSVKCYPVEKYLTLHKGVRT